MNNQVSTRWGIVAIVVLVLAMSRLLPHTVAFSLFNFSPIGGIALFSAAYFNKKYMAYLLPVVALWVSNLLINNLFYAQYFEGFSWFANPEVYFAFLLIVLMGSSLLKKITVPRLAIGALSSSLIFFIVTNFYVWLNTAMYAKSAAGLVACYVAAIPFYWNTLASDLLYTGVLFGLFEYAKRQYPTVVLQKV